MMKRREFIAGSAARWPFVAGVVIGYAENVTFGSISAEA